MTDNERKAYYRGRSDAFAGDLPDVAGLTSGEAAEYQRGYRHAKAEDRLDADSDWD